MRHCAQAIQFFSKKCRSGGEQLATLCSAWDLNLRLPAPETNALPIDLQYKIMIACLLKQYKNKSLILELRWWTTSQKPKKILLGRIGWSWIWSCQSTDLDCCLSFYCIKYSSSNQQFLGTFLQYFKLTLSSAKQQTENNKKNNAETLEL